MKVCETDHVRGAKGIENSAAGTKVKTLQLVQTVNTTITKIRELESALNENLREKKAEGSMWQKTAEGFIGHLHGTVEELQGGTPRRCA